MSTTPVIDAAVQRRAGLIYGLSAYLLWGVLPLYFKALAHVSAAVAGQRPDTLEWMLRAVAAGEQTGNAALATLIRRMQVVFTTLAGEMDAARRIAVEAYDQARAIGKPIEVHYE